MKHLVRPFLLWALTALLFAGVWLSFTGEAQAQRKSRSGTLRRTAKTPLSAYERGYAAGYSDGYNSGKDDYNTHLGRDYQRRDQYHQASRGYQEGFGDLTEFQDGYRTGYEIAYMDGYYGRPVNAKITPNVLALRSTTTAPATQQTATSDRRTRTVAGSLIPDKTEIKLRLTETINTKVNREGDRFKAAIVTPTVYEGAIVEGHIAKLNRSGRVTGRTELALDFDTITMPDGRSGPFRAQIERIYESENIKSVDEEGNVETSNKTRDTQIRTAGGAALGAIIGAIAGGGKGAAIGAIVGAGAGAGSVYVQGNKDIILEAGTEMSVRTTVPQGEKTR